MSKKIEEKLLKIPVIGSVLRFSMRIKLPGMEGLSLYELMETYIVGIAKGTFSFRAGAIAFSFFMALFPFILFILNLIPFVPIENFQQEFLLFIDEFLPPQTASIFNPIIADIAENPRGSLLSFTIILVIFLMSNGVNAIFSGFNSAFYITQRRGFLRQYGAAIIVSVFLSLLLFVAVIALLVGQYFIVYLNENSQMLSRVNWIVILRLILFYVMIYATIATLYYYGTKESKSYRFFSIGATITSMLFVITTYLFGIYIDNFSNYNELYGSIGAILILMTYIWVNSNLLLLGFELNVTVNKLRNRNKKEETS